MRQAVSRPDKQAQRNAIRELAEQDLQTFIELVAPERMLSGCHKEVLSWWERPDAKTHQLLLFPRDHMKSALVAYRVAWHITKDPTLRILYISATSNLAEKQLSFIKTILTSDTYRMYWPEHVEKEEGKRTKWTNTEIALDHPDRKKENIRDSTVFTAGLTTSITGLHCDIAVMDDVVVYENAYTTEGRNKVQSQYSLLASIEGADSKEWVVGTRYHPADLYNDMLEMVEEIYDEDGSKVSEEPIYEVLERQVESDGDGTGEFLWPRSQRRDGKWFGFDIRVLSQKRGKYLDKTQFRAQYYNDPSSPDDVPVSHDKFQYYNRERLTYERGYWYYMGSRLNVVASMDFAYSLNKKADSTTIVVLGVDSKNNFYILDLDRFKTDRISVYFDRLKRVATKWYLRKLIAETTAAQAVIVKQLKELIAENGLAISVKDFRPTKDKQERISAALEPRYDNAQMWHYRGGNISVLEDELASRNSAHDDCKDALATAVDHVVKPVDVGRRTRTSIDWSKQKFRGA